MPLRFPMKTIRLTHTLPLIILLSSFYYLGNTPRQQEDRRRWPSREQILDNLFSDRRLLFVYGTGRPERVAQYRAWAAEYQKRTRRLQITIKSDREVTRAELASQAVYLAGTVASNSWLAHFSAQLPVKFNRDGFQFLGKDYREPGDLIALFYPNPANPQQPLLLLAGNRDEEVLRSELFRPGGDYRIFRNGECLVFGNFSQAADRRWAFDSAGHHDFAAEMRLAKETEHFRFYTHGAVLPAAELEQFAAEREQHYERLTALLGRRARGMLINFHLYPNFEEKGLITANTEIAHCDRERQAVHVTVNHWVRGETEGCEADLVIARALGVPRHALLATGLRVSFTDNWRNHGYEYWASRLYLSGNVPALADMLDNAKFERDSYLMMEPLAATFTNFLVQLWGREKFLANFADWSPAAAEVPRLDQEWRAYLEQLAQRFHAQIADDITRFPQADSFQKGFCHAHEGYQIYNGYLSRRSDEALTKLADLGVNAVSITPFTAITDPQRPEFFRFWRSAGSENDESVIHAAHTAQRLGMAVMLKPHIWVGHGGWPGDIKMASPQDWRQFFDFYYRWIRHYALLAEMYGMERFCIGVELEQTTLGHEQEWRDLIAKVRRLYSGELVYAANWGEEFENIRFWDALDYLGLNCYYPLSDQEEASAADLRRGAAAAMAKVAAVAWRFRKPVLLTEVGFTSTAAPWQQPHAEGRGRPLNLADQARCYEAVFQAVAGKFWCRGLYWWKWPSDLAQGGPLDTEFTPNNKPAEQVVARWYRNGLAPALGSR